MALRHRAAARGAQMRCALPRRSSAAARLARPCHRPSLLRVCTETPRRSAARHRFAGGAPEGSTEQRRSIVEPTAVSPFAAWESFYVIIGSSGAALTGLQFVVVVLGAEARSIGPEVGAFGTPTVVHFCAVLLMSAILSVPWRAVSHAGLSLAAVGVAGIVYMAVVIRRARRPTRYVPVLEDWLWHCAFPLIAYVTLLVAALAVQRDPPVCLLVIGATALLLLFIGIHNAWDAVTYIATQQPQHREGPRDEK